MKFKPGKKRRVVEKQVKINKAVKEQKSICLGDFCDDYPDLIEVVTIPVDKETCFKLTVKRGGTLGLPQLELREWKDTKKHSGYTKRGISIPCNVLEEVSDAVVKIFDLVEERGYDHE